MLGLLVISASAPPVGGAGTIRMAKFVKYLPEFGYQPVIVSLDEGYFKRAYIDESLLDDVREATIYRLSPSIDNISSIGKPLRNLRYLRLAKRAFRENRIDIIFSTHPLPTAHLVALRLKQGFGIPWVADFRDGFLSHPFYSAPFWRRRYDARLEQSIAENADVILTATRGIADYFISRYDIAGKVVFIPNGFDPDDFGDKGLGHSGKFSMLYTGTISRTMRADNLLLAVSKLKKENVITADNFEALFVGQTTDEFSRLVKKENLGEIVKSLSPRPHSEICRVMEQASAFLLMVPDCRSCVQVLTSKLFEYIGARRPIFALLPEKNEAKELIEKYNLGIVARCGDVADIADTLSKMIESCEFSPDPKVYERFNRKNQAKRLADIFGYLIEGGR